MYAWVYLIGWFNFKYVYNEKKIKFYIWNSLELETVSHHTQTFTKTKNLNKKLLRVNDELTDRLTGHEKYMKIKKYKKWAELRVKWKRYANCLYTMNPWFLLL